MGDLDRLADRLDVDNIPAKEYLKRLAVAMQKRGLEPEEFGRVRSVRFSDYQTLIKNAESEAEVHDLKAAALVLSPSWETGPEWDPVSQAAPAKLPPVRAKPARRDGIEVAAILPDPQIGFRRDLETGELDPFHDEQAIDVALQIVKQAKPDLVVLLGDVLDFAEQGRFEQEPGFTLTTQPAIDYGHRFLAAIRAAAPHARIVMLEGNHDRRLLKAIVNNAKWAFGLRRAGNPSNWPVLSVPFLLRMDELDVEYVEGYPAGEWWINDNLRCIHGRTTRSNASTAAAVVKDERVSNIFGHVHRIEQSYKTRGVKDGPKVNLAATPGALCRIDGAVPSAKGSYDMRGRAIEAWENWQQGMAVVTYEPGDGRFWYEQVFIHDGHGMWRGKGYTAEAGS